MTKFEIEKYNWSAKFSLWQIKMHAVLIQQKISKTLKENDKISESMSKNENEEMNEKVLMSIQLCLSNKVLPEIAHEKTAVDF